jgi:O-antigen/teichoic acid export membrane protein
LKILKNSLIYTVVSILQKALAFFLLPLYTVFLSKDDFGIVSVITSVTNLLSIFFLLGLNGALSRFYYDNKNDIEFIKDLFGTISIFILIISTVVGIVIILFHNYLLDPFIKGIDFYPCVFLGLISIILSPLYLLYQTTLQTKQLAGKYGLNNLLYFICNIGLTILFVVPFRLKAVGFLLAIALTNLIFFIASLFSFIPMMKFTIKKRILTDSLKYSLPLVPHSLSSWIVTMLDRLFLNNLKNNESVGLYSIGYQFGNILNIVTSGVNQAFAPWFFDKMQEKNDSERKKIIQFGEYMIVLYCMIALLITFFGKEILSFMVTRDFRESWVIISFISFGYVFSGLYYFFVNPLFFCKKGTKWVPVATFTGAIVSSGLNILLIPYWGIVGSALSNLISNFVISVLVLIFMKKIEPVQYKWIKMYLIIFISFGLSLIIYMEKFLGTEFVFIVKIVIITILCIILYFCYKKEMMLLKDLFFKKLRS